MRNKFFAPPPNYHPYQTASAFRGHPARPKTFKWKPNDEDDDVNERKKARAQVATLLVPKRSD